ncbi:MAG TPA: terminase small subunit [Acidimicrobiia bacterium]|nr:terminase small subunit [Acidimicrobiia bacterium]
MSKRSLAELRSRGARVRTKKPPATANGTAVDSRYADRDVFGSFGLTRRQAMFVLEYISDPGSQTHAAVRAGYSPQSAAAQATELLKQPNVKRAVQQIQERLRENTEITAEAVLKRLSQIAFDTRPKPRSADQVKALELMSKWLGLEVSNGNVQVELVVHYESDRERELYIEDVELEEEGIQDAHMIGMGADD